MDKKFVFSVSFERNTNSLNASSRFSRSRGGSRGGFRGRGRGRGRGRTMVSRASRPVRRGRARLRPVVEERKKSKRKSMFEKEYNRGIDFDDYDPIWGGFTKKKERRGRF